MSQNRTLKASRLMLALLIAFIVKTTTVLAAGGGGSSAIFSVDPGSPSGAPGNLYVDDIEDTTPGVISPLTLALPAAALGISAAANLDALGGGRDTGVFVALNPISAVPNVLDQTTIVYQFSVGRDARDDVTGFQTIPFAPFPLPPYIDHTDEYATQFSEGHAHGDILVNWEGMLGVAGRVNSRAGDHLKFKFFGPDETPTGETHNLDAFTSIGAIGGGPDTDPENGILDDGVWIYYSVEGPAGIAGLPGPPPNKPAIIYVAEGTGAPTTPEIYFDPIAAGLLSVGDDVDAVDVWDSGAVSERNGLFEPGDGIVFSLRAGSPSLTIVIGGVAIDEGGIFLIAWVEGPPGFFSPEITCALPGRYFSLAEADESLPADELDEIHCVDPRDPVAPSCPGMSMRMAAPLESLVPSPPYAEMFLPARGPLCLSPVLEIFVTMNDRRRPGMPVVSAYGGTVIIEGRAAELLGASPFLYGPPPPTGGCRGCCTNCGGGSCAPCTGPTPEFSGCNLAGLWPGLIEWDICVACVTVLAVAPGTSTINVDIAPSTMGGIPFEVGASQTIIRVLSDCNFNGVWDDDDIASGMSLDCNANGWPDSCDIATGFSMDADSDGVPDECDSLPGCTSMCLGDVNADGKRDATDIKCFVECVFGRPTAVCPACGCGDMNDDGATGPADTALFVEAIILGSDAMCP